MPITITVTLGDTPKSEIVRAAEFLLASVGYERPEPSGVSAEEKQAVAAIAPQAPEDTTTIVTGIDVDAAGLPWDDRIHSGSRAKNADGTWRQKRGVNDADFVKRVEVELRQRVTPALTGGEAAGVLNGQFVPPAPQTDMALPTPVPVEVVPTPVPPPFVPSAVPSAPPVSTIPTAPVSAGAAMAASHSENVTFPQFMNRATQALAAKTLSVDKFNGTLKAHGVENTMMLSQRPDLVPVIYAELFA